MMEIIKFIVLSVFVLSYASVNEYSYDRVELEWDIQERNNNMSDELGEKPNNPDKCFAPCWVMDLPNPNDNQISEYTGTDKNAIGVKEVEIVLEKETTRWVQKIDYINCLSIEPSECLMWCIIKVPEVTDIIYVVDTLIQKNFKPYIYRPEVPYKVNQRYEWREVVCTDDITEELYEGIRLALKGKGYDDMTDAHFNLITMSLVLKYQEDNNLPVGYLNLETMESLGINN